LIAEKKEPVIGLIPCHTKDTNIEVEKYLICIFLC